MTHDDHASTETKSGFYIWRGLNHVWLRRVAGFRVPHRISKLHSFIDEETHLTDKQGQWTPRAFFQFGQSTGVDGNYMQPEGFYQAIHAPDVHAQREDVLFEFSDQLEDPDAAYPIARSTQQHTVDVELPAGHDTAVAILRGIELDMHCDNGKQPRDRPCNSHGMWPSWLEIDASPCVIQGNRATVVVRIVIHRAWTPHLGGLPPFEVKPLNVSLDVRVRVPLTIISGNSGEFNTSPGPDIQHIHLAQTSESRQLRSGIQGAPTQFIKATSAIRGFGFELMPRTDASKQKHLGRYIDILHAALEDETYNPATGVLTCTAHAQVGVPKTVVDTQVRAWIKPVLLQFSDPKTQLRDTTKVVGKLCANSEGAPFFSRWKKCGDAEKGPEQREQRNAL